jgi:hypothetical protein
MSELIEWGLWWKLKAEAEKAAMDKAKREADSKRKRR